MNKFIATDNITFKHGITGNYYFISTDKQKLVDICNQINKCSSSIRWSDKVNGFVIRIKSKYHKNQIKQLRKKYV